GVAGEHLPVGPLGLQGPVESFDLAVLPGAVWLDEHLPGIQGRDHIAQAVLVGPGVVGHDPLDPGDAVGGEVVGGPSEERRAGRALLIGQDLAVGQPGVVIDQGVDVIEPDLGGAVVSGFPSGAAVRAPATPVGDPADLLDVHVHQLAGTVAFIAHRGGLAGADHLAADRVELTQVGQSVAAQDPRHGPRTDAEFGPEPVRPTTFPLPQGHDLVGELAAGAGRATMRARGTLAKPILALAAIPVDPARGALARDTHFLGHVRDRAPLPEYPIDNDAAAVQGQPGITVGHENLRSEWVLDKPHPNRRFSPHQQPFTGVSRPPTVTNVMAEYN